jgi:hypothetical protein
MLVWVEKLVELNTLSKVQIAKFVDKLEPITFIITIDPFCGGEDMKLAILIKFALEYPDRDVEVIFEEE